MSLRTLCIAIACGIAASCCGCHGRQPRDVILVVVDTLRADHVDCSGGGHGLTPALDRLAARGVCFNHAYAPTSWTMPSVASLFTSRLASQHRVVGFSGRLADDEVTLAERLSAGGYRTGAVSANLLLNAEGGFAQGFATWRTLGSAAKDPVKIRGAEVRASIRQWLDAESAADRRQPHFIYAQYMEPHTPLEPPADLRARRAPQVTDAQVAELNRKVQTISVSKGMTPSEAAALAQLYDGEVEAADRELQQLFDDLEARGRLDDALIIVTADHGEEFLEHGAVGHGYNLFDTTVRVPLIIVGPGIPAGHVVSDNVSLIDLAPTVLDLLGLPPEPRFVGRSLRPLLNGDGAGGGASDVVLQLRRKGPTWDQRAHADGLVRGSQKLLVAPSGAAQLFDLARDPGEQTPSADAERRTELVSALADAENSLMPRTAQAAAPRKPMDAATRERLRALGYHN